MIKGYTSRVRPRAHAHPLLYHTRTFIFVAVVVVGERGLFSYGRHSRLVVAAIIVDFRSRTEGERLRHNDCRARTLYIVKKTHTYTREFAVGPSSSSTRPFVLVCNRLPRHHGARIGRVIEWRPPSILLSSLLAAPTTMTSTTEKKAKGHNYHDEQQRNQREKA